MRAAVPTAYPKVRLIFCRARCPHRPFPGGPVCRPYEWRNPLEPFPVAFCLLFRHGKRRSPPAGGESSLQETKPLYHRPLIRPFGPPSPRGEGFWGRGSFVRSFSKRSRKAGQRRGGEIPRTLYLLWLKPPQSGFNKEGSTHETNQMRKRRNLQT